MKRRSKAPDVGQALEVIAARLLTRLEHGAGSTATIRVGDLDVEVTIRSRRALQQDDAAQFRQAALDKLGRGQIDGRCCKSVRDRGPWSYKSSKGCSKPIAAAVVHPPASYLGPGPRFEFCCAQHLDELSGRSGVLGVVHLSPSEVKNARERSKQVAALRERGVLIAGDSAKVDLGIELALVELASLRADCTRESDMREAIEIHAAEAA